MKPQLLFFAPSRGRFVLLSLLAGGLLGICSCESRILPRVYRVEFPSLPVDWEEVLGAPRWRVEWIDPRGTVKSLESDGGRDVELDLMETWANAVLAYPFWPDRELPPGMFRPAGALYPFDVREGRVPLSWKGGVGAWFYQCLREAASRGFDESGGRRPERFDWPRFRTLLEEGDIDAAAAADLWLADWQDIADKTLQSGFDRRRIKARKAKDLPVTIPWTGRYVGSSPFVPAAYWEAGEAVILSVGSETATYAAAQGLLRCAPGGGILLLPRAPPARGIENGKWRMENYGMEN